MTRAPVLTWILLVAATCGWSTPAQAKVSEQGGELYSIERRNLLGSHEISAALGTLPVDAFAKGLTLHLTDHIR